MVGCISTVLLRPSFLLCRPGCGSSRLWSYTRSTVQYEWPACGVKPNKSTVRRYDDAFLSLVFLFAKPVRSPLQLFDFQNDHFLNHSRAHFNSMTPTLIRLWVRSGLPKTLSFALTISPVTRLSGHLFQYSTFSKLSPDSRAQEVWLLTRLGNHT